MIEPTARERRTFDDYEMQGPILRPHDLRAGRPRIRAAIQAETGMPVLVKSWPRRQGMDDRELEEIWRHEVRQLHRLASYPRARDRLATLVESVELDDAFHLLLRNDQRLPLQLRLDEQRPGDWFRAPRTQRGRLRLWSEMARVAEGLEILHAQGLLHRNLDTWGVLTSAGEEPDFLLTGFEWSIRLSSALRQARPARRTGAARTTTYSFYEDWRALGVLACRLLNFPNRARAGEPYQPNVAEPAEFLLAAERDLLTLLLTADPLQRIDAEVVLGRIRAIIEALAGQLGGTEPKLVLALILGDESRLSRAIFEASAGEIEPYQLDLQFDFVQQDLSDRPRLTLLKAHGEARARYVLRGRHLVYRLQQFIPPNGGQPTWGVARCQSVDDADPGFARIDTTLDLDPQRIEVMSIGRALNGYSRLVGATTAWDALGGAAVADPVVDALADRTYAALTLFQIVETLVQASQVWPVRLTRERNVGAVVHVELEARSDPSLERLSDALGLDRPAVRLSRLMAGESPEVDGEWRLADQPVVGVRGGERAKWQLIDVRRDRGADVYVFEGPDSPPPGSELYLRAGGVGQDQLLRRRLKALRALREHAELLDMLANPRLHRRASHEPWRLEHLRHRIDSSKVEALREMTAVLPLYLLQGPPGVGKTKLVEELVSERMGADGTERLLLSAQSHAAVDHLLEKVQIALARGRDASRPDPIVALRCRPRDHGSGSGPWDLPVRAAAVAADLAGSDLVARAPAHLRSRATELVTSLARAAEPEADEDASAMPDRSFTSLLLRSANLVFASTNARELETLVDERSQFDWSIVEEAGKATGVDLLAPMLLSHRRLMIGDHKQLPPFGAEQMEALFAAPERITAALEAGRHLVARPFGQAGLEGALDLVESGDMVQLGGHARSMLFLFETLVEGEVAVPPRPGRRRTFRRLDQQHRMHPAIGRLVSEAFYEGGLETSEEARARFRLAPPVGFDERCALPDTPVLFVDMPFAHATPGVVAPERPPRWTNREEAAACVDVLRCLRGSGGRPEVAVLTPYRAQMRVLADSVARARADGGLGGLAAFDEVGGSLCHTVDSFQGNEADVVIISLVRNNPLSGARALGFLSDRRRMNVLMSRARWKLVLVGSLAFLRERFQDELVQPEIDRLDFLRSWLATFDALCAPADGSPPMARVVPRARLSGVGA